MICPKCHSETHVLKTIKYETVVLRIRVCDRCHFSFTTEENAQKEAVSVSN